MSSEVVPSIGQNIARYRKAEGLSAAELADKTGEGLTRSVLANLENGRKDDVTVKQLMALANALRVPPAFLIADLFDPGSPSPYPMPSYSVRSFDYESQSFTESTAGHRNNNLLNWVTAKNLRSNLPHTGAPELVAKVMNATLSYTAAVSSFERSIPQLIEARADHARSNDRETADWLAYASDQTRDAATLVLTTARTLSSLGVVITRTDQTVHDAMDELGLAFEDGMGAELAPFTDGYTRPEHG